MHRLLITLLFYLLSVPAPADPGEALGTVYWIKNYAPPFYINQGRDAGEGFADGTQSFYEQALPQFKHRTVYASLARLNAFWEEGANYCFASMIHKPLPADSPYILSQPNVYYVPHGVITRRGFAPTANLEQIPLAALLEQPNQVLGLIGNRSFGATIDDLVARYKQDSRYFVRRDRDGLRGLLNMLLLGRIDYLIDYAFVFDYYRKREPFAEQMQFVTLEETDQRGVLGAIGCTNNPWGKTMIAHINQATDNLLQSPQYRAFVSQWQAAGIDDASYWQAFFAERDLRRTSGHTP